CSPMLTKAPSSKLLEVVCGGTPREMGLAQGRALREKIHAAHAALADLEAFRLVQPWWLPYPLYRWLAERKAWNFFAAPLAQNFPEVGERLAGIAEGAGGGIKAL